MNGFVNKKIDSQKTLAEILKERREELELDWSVIEQESRISRKYLQALENADYKKLPAEIYVSNFLKTYAGLLGLDSNKLVNLYLKEKDLYQKILKGKDLNGNLKEVGKTKFLITPKLIRSAIIALIVLVLLSYLGWEVKKIFTPPFLQINKPENNLVTDKTSIKVEGQTEEEVEITINGQDILSDSQGYFTKDVNLQEGINIIEISAQKKHSRENKSYRQIMVVK